MHTAILAYVCSCIQPIMFYVTLINQYHNIIQQNIWGQKLSQFLRIFSLTVKVFKCMLCSSNAYTLSFNTTRLIKRPMTVCKHHFTEPQTSTITPTEHYSLANNKKKLLIPFSFTFLDLTHGSFKVKKSPLPDPEGP